MKEAYNGAENCFQDSNSYVGPSQNPFPMENPGLELLEWVAAWRTLKGRMLQNPPTYQKNLTNCKYQLEAATDYWESVGRIFDLSF